MVVQWYDKRTEAVFKQYKEKQVICYIRMNILSFLACEESRDKLSASFTENDRLTKCLPKWDGAACWPPIGELMQHNCHLVEYTCYRIFKVY